MKNLGNRAVLITLCLVLFAGISLAQTTAFNYQGSLSTGGLPANGSFDMEFALFDAVAGGGQLGSTITLNGIAVTDGIFSAALDFGDQFPGAARFLEIRVRQTGGGSFTTLTPRQPVTSTPYAIKSATADDATTAALADNALQLGGVAANQFVITTDPRMTDPRPPTAGSSNYVQNQNAGVQAASNFNISGDGTAGGTLSGNVVNSTIQYNIGGSRVLSVGGTGNVFAGFGAGGSNTSGAFNSYFGRDAGFSNTMGSSNAFFGADVGRFNTGSSNAFFGAHTGQANTTGDSNAFFGARAGQANTTGASNAFFGARAGEANTTGAANAFFGSDAGGSNTGGTHNAFFGRQAGTSNTTGSYNAFLGRSAGSSNTTGSDNTFVGKNAGQANTEGGNNSFFGRGAGVFNTTGSNNTLIGRLADVNSGNLSFATAIGAYAVASLSNSIFLGRASGSDTVRVPGNLVVTGTTSLNGNLAVASGATAIFSGGVSGISTAVSGTTYGVYGETASTSGRGVYGVSTAGTGTTYGVYGESASTMGRGVIGYATSTTGNTYGTYGRTDSTSGRGIYGFASSATGTTSGVYGLSGSTSGRGVFGLADAGTGTTFGGRFESNSTSGRGVYGFADAASGNTIGVWGQASSSTGVGVYGSAGAATGINHGGWFTTSSNSGRGVYGAATSNSGTTYGVAGQANSGSGFGVYSFGNTGASGTKSFRIDHPDDPANKYLLHYSTESPEVLNIYSGSAMLDENGEAIVTLPGYFTKINRDPRYLLTAVGAPMPMLHVAEEISNDALKAGAEAKPGQATAAATFTISGGKPGAKVSWEVKAVRNDQWTRQNKTPVETIKQDGERGTYQHPELYGKPKELGINYDAKRERAPEQPMEPEEPGQQ